MAEDDFDKTVKLNPGGKQAPGPDADKTVKLDPEMDRTVKITPSAPPVPPVESMISSPPSRKFNPVSLALVLIVLLASAAGAWVMVPPFLKKKADQLSKEGDHVKAAKQLRAALFFHPRDPEDYWVALGKEQRLSNDLAQAQASLEKVLAIKPNHYEANRELGLTLKVQGQNQKAFEVFSNCIAANPDDREVLSMAAQIAYDLKEYKSAAPLYEKLTLTGGDAEDFQKLGISYLETGKAEEGAQALLKASEKNKNLKEVNGLLAKIFFGQGQFDQALARSEAELATRGGGPAAGQDIQLVNLLVESAKRAGENALKAKNYASAKDYFERGLKVESNQAGELHLLLAKTYALQKKKKDAMAQLKEAFAINGALKREARREKAFQAYRKSPDFQKVLR